MHFVKKCEFYPLVIRFRFGALWIPTRNDFFRIRLKVSDPTGSGTSTLHYNRKKKRNKKAALLLRGREQKRQEQKTDYRDKGSSKNKIKNTLAKTVPSTKKDNHLSDLSGESHFVLQLAFNLNINGSIEHVTPLRIQLLHELFSYLTKKYLFLLFNKKFSLHYYLFSHSLTTITFFYKIFLQVNDKLVRIHSRDS